MRKVQLQFGKRTTGYTVDLNYNRFYSKDDNLPLQDCGQLQDMMDGGEMMEGKPRRAEGSIERLLVSSSSSWIQKEVAGHFPFFL